MAATAVHLPLLYLDEDLLERAHRLVGVPPDDLNLDKFSPRERQVLALAVEGARRQEIAWLLGISYHTVESNFRHMCEKAGTRNRVQLLVLAARRKGGV